MTSTNRLLLTIFLIIRYIIKRYQIHITAKKNVHVDIMDFYQNFHFKHLKIYF